MHDEDALERRPGLTVMPEYGVNLPVWYGPGGDRFSCLDAEELAALGVSDGLVERLRAWQDSWERKRPPFKTWNTGDQVVAGVPLGVRLARQLQAELPGHRIFLGGSDPVPWRTGPGDLPDSGLAALLISQARWRRTRSQQ